jgi:hypothetical protein
MITELVSTEDGSEGRADFPLFDRSVDVLINGDGITIDYAQRCAAAVDVLSEDMVNDLCRASDRYRLTIIGHDGRPAEPPQTALLQLEPLCLQLWPPVDSAVGYSIELNAKWAPEHGLEWTIADSQVIYVGPVIGACPWADPSEFSQNFIL